jgi:hypothetical protein
MHIGSASVTNYTERYFQKITIKFLGYFGVFLGYFWDIFGIFWVFFWCLFGVFLDPNLLTPIFLLGIYTQLHRLSTVL